MKGQVTVNATVLGVGSFRNDFRTFKPDFFLMLNAKYILEHKKLLCLKLLLIKT